jgi:hypothetical protein
VELVVVNFRAAGKARRTTFNGRDYLVAPMTLIVPGVVPGSEGPLLYPLEELARNYQAWNYMPIVINHPLRGGRHVSAREPAILEESGVGFVFNASLDGRLRGEGWFDVERTRRVDVRVLDRLERGEPLELSTGLYVDTEAAPQGAVWNTPGGPRPYRAVARNYRPDHLAVLPDQRGACAVDDGCGVLVNAGEDQPPGGVTTLPDVGGEDWGSYSREEILDLLTEAALESLDGPAGNAFNPNQPRDERGRFAGAGGHSRPEGKETGPFAAILSHSKAQNLDPEDREKLRADLQRTKDRLGDSYGGTAVKMYGGGTQVEVYRVKHGYHGAEKVIAATFPLPEHAPPGDFGHGMGHAARAELRTSSAAHVREFVTKGGPATHVEVGALADHLARLTVAQLHDLRKEHGLPAQGTWKQRKPELVQALATRLAEHRASLPTPVTKQLQAAATAHGDFKEAGYKPSDSTHTVVHETTGYRVSAHPDGKFRVWDRNLTHEASHSTATAALAHAASPPRPKEQFRETVADFETKARQEAVANATARRRPTGNDLNENLSMASLSARLGTQLAGFVGAGNDWNEFTTWAHFLPPGEYTTVKTLSVNAQVKDAGSLDSELAQATVEVPPETDGAVAVAGRLLSILGDYAEPSGRLSVVANELSHSDLERRLEALLFEKYQPAGGSSTISPSMDSLNPSPYLVDVYDDYIIYRWMDKTYSLGYTVDDQTDKVALDADDPVEVARTMEYVPVDNLLWDYEADTPLVNAKASLAGGRWVTIQGSPVYVKGDKIIAGPTRLKGTTVDASKATAHKAAPLPTGKKAAARADAATGGRGESSPASAPSPKAAKAPAGKVAGKAVDPMAGHPLEGKTEDEVRAIIRQESYPTTASSRDPFKLAGHPADPALAAGVLSAVHDAQAKSSYFQPKIHELFDAARAADPSVTLLHFQRTLAAMDHAGQIRLWPYTQSINTMPRPETAMPFGYEAKHHVGPPDRRPASNMRDDVELEVQVPGPVQQVGNANGLTLNQLEYLSPAEACEVLSEGEFEGEELSSDDEEFLRERCSGFTANAGKGGLSTPDVTMEKACKILKDGTIRGKELTPRQRGLFGILCGRRKKPRGPARNQATEESSQTPVDNAFCATGAGGGVDPSCSPSSGKQGAEPPTPTMPAGHKEWGKVLKPFTEAELGQMADRLISHVGDPSFKEQVEWQAGNYQGLHGSGLAKRPEALRARAALETFVSDTSNAAGQTRKGAVSVGASSGHFVSGGDERKAWRAAWKIANGHPVSNVVNTESSQTSEVSNEREETSMSRLTDEQRRIIVDNLVANTGCGCHGQTMPWPNERAALEKLTDNELAFADGCRKALVQNHASGPGGGSVATGPTAAQGAQQAANRNGQGGGPTTNVVDPSQIVVPVATPVKAPANMAEALATYGTAQDREVWNSALAIHAHEKASVIETIVANVTGEARERLIARLQTKNIDELRELAVLGAQHRVQPQPLSPAVNWFGASAAAVAPPVQEEPLTSPVYSFERRSA